MKRVLTIATMAVLFSGAGFAGTIDAKALFSNTCATCHGQKAEKKALGRSEIIANNGYDDIIKDLKEFKSGKGDKIMQAQVAKFSLEELDAIAKYIDTLKDPKTQKASTDKVSRGNESVEDESEENNESN